MTYIQAPKTSPKDFFMHLGATLALYVSAIALLNLLFTLINKAIPDALSSYWSASSIVWPVSILIVLVPTLYILEWAVSRDLDKDSAKQWIWIRRWRIYLTLFLTGATILGDIIVLVSTYMNGELTGRFLYKVLSVLIVAGIIFAYYLIDRRDRDVEGKTAHYPTQTAMIWLGAVLVVASIASGFIVVGSPSRQRDLRFDSQRISDLMSIQYQITDYWQRTGSLPKDLTSLRDPLSGQYSPKDPSTGSEYEYQAFSSMTGPSKAAAFSLCAVFARSSDEQGTSVSSFVMTRGNDDWSHPAGKACFNRTIDPARYPVRKTL